MKPGVILAFLTYFNLILMAVMGINRIFVLYSKASASAQRIGEVLETPEGLPEQTGVTDTPGTPGAQIEFDHVTFSYRADAETEGGAFAGEERQAVLSDITFTVAPGESLGIIGATGSGKSTILHLLLRFYDPGKGRVLVNGKDIRLLSEKELRDHFGVAFQGDMVFDDTLEGNIDFGRHVSKEALSTAIRSAQAEGFASGEGLQRQAGIRGQSLSGGQKQRTLVARALAARPDILLLDDASSALDYETDARMRRAIRENYEGTTLLLVAQRVSSVMNLDRILVLEDGRILDIGTHGELMKRCALYQEMAKTQMGEAATAGLQTEGR